MNILHRALCICIVSNVVHSQLIIPDISRLFSRLASATVAATSDRQFRRIRCRQMPWLEHCRRRRHWRANREGNRNPEFTVSTWSVDSHARDPRVRTDPIPPFRGDPDFPQGRPGRPIDPPFMRPDRRDSFESHQNCNISCPRGSHLHAGECQYGSSLCNPACQDDYTCRHGRCVRDPCRFPCGPGLSCRNGMCVDANVCRRPCCQDQECKKGQCIEVPQCVPACPVNFICHNGHCDKVETTKICHPECPPNYICRDGHCDKVDAQNADSCPIPCGPGRHCHEGHCEPDNHGQLPDHSHHHNNHDVGGQSPDHSHHHNNHDVGGQLPDHPHRHNTQDVGGHVPDLGQGNPMFLDPVSQGPVSGISGFQDPLTGLGLGGPRQFGPGRFGNGQFGLGQGGSGQSGPRQFGSGQGVSGQGGLGQFGPGRFGPGQGGPGQFGPGRGGPGQIVPGFPPPSGFGNSMFPQGGPQTRISPFGNPQQAPCAVPCMTGFRCVSGRCVPGGNIGGSTGGMPFDNVFNFPQPPQQQGNMGGNTPPQNQNGPVNQFPVASQVPIQTGQPTNTITDPTVRNFLFPESNGQTETASFTDPIFGQIST